MNFTLAFKTVAVMLLCAVPGFILIKSRVIGEKFISAFAKLLLYVCQPCLVVDSMTGVDFSSSVATGLAVVFAVVLLSELVTSGILFLLLKNKQTDVRYRIMTIASCMGNVSFMGIPVIRALIPGNPAAVAYTAAASFALNVYGWTVASAIISRNKKYISAKKIFLNPATVAVAVSIPFFVTNTDVPGALGDMVSLIGHFATPLCMIVMGARLATSSAKEIFLTPRNYVAVAIKQIAYPLVMLGIVTLLPLDVDMKRALYIMACCPVASMVLNFSELVGEGTRPAASVLLLGTSLSSITLPLMVLLI